MRKKRNSNVYFLGQGAGDLNIKAIYNNIESTTINIEDLTYYDPSSNNNLSKYSIPNNATVTYDSSEHCYVCQTNSSGTNTMLLNNLKLSNNVKIQTDILFSNSNNCQPRIGLWNGNNGITSRAIIYQNDTYFGISSQTKGSDGTNLQLQSNIGITTNVWYTFEVTYSNGTVTAVLKQGDTVIQTLTATENVLGSTGNDFGIDLGYHMNIYQSIFKFKNIKILEL